ncbi:DEAD/DEAH box helicase family protein [uncultured Kordia sp.]|uniref:DEAD/DEAH box helicase family protein n=1 Tax=uncultured Kordia sp. TaxID=507699 RepID=UPI00261CFA8A|nr:DEAD/DEAH box helicase family protein [uncultured Kordia sp.]
MNKTPKLISKTPFESLQFQLTWRNYQEKFLAFFDLHLNDNHLHVVAPPGSGKTILGLEMLRRVQKKTIVFAPTLTIRNQWKDRLQSFFTTDGSFLEYSFDLKQPALLTFTTYQSLHSFYKSFETQAEFLAHFENYGIEAIVLDEAHHLKNEWWKCLFALKNDRKLTTIALTATPPIDSTDQELSRYFELCGPIDEEIAVPDLVKEGDLCPHQDYIHFSTPTEEQVESIVEYREKVADFADNLEADEQFLFLLETHRFLTSTDDHLEEIYKEPSYLSSILIFLNALGETINPYLYEVLGFDVHQEVSLPKLDYNWIEILLQNILFTDREQLVKHEELLQKLENRLRRNGMLQKKRVRIFGDDQLYKTLANSPSKLQSIVDIIQQEYRNLNTELRAVILTDYIRKEFLKFTNIEAVNQLGVLPIFQHLRTSLKRVRSIGVLSGTMVIIPKKCLPILDSFHPDKSYNYSLLDYDDEFVNISISSKVKSGLVADITKLFELGHINVLIGTKSLLGEGWDSPAINSLVLASFVGSYVSSNQMRGRAIRSQEGNPNKISNIWHLACIDPTADDGGDDLAKLQRRFHAFVGVSNIDPIYITTGIGRLALPMNYDDEIIQNINIRTFENAANRKTIKNRWETAIKKGNSLTTEIQYFTEQPKLEIKRKKVYQREMSSYIAAECIMVSFVAISEIYIHKVLATVSSGFLYSLYSIIGLLGIFLGYKIFKKISIYSQSQFVYKNIDNIGKAILHSLHDLGYITTPLDEIKIKSEQIYLKGTICNIDGTTRVESALFVKAFQEILNPIENPRYILEKSSVFKELTELQNYYAVPAIFGGKKKDVEVFLGNWRMYVNGAHLHYTRTVEGRKLLIKARLFHVTNVFKNTTKKEVIWK